MPLHVRLLLPRDIPQIVKFNQLAWEHGQGDVFKRDVFQPYEHDCPEARAIYSDFYAAELEHADPTETYLVAVLTPESGADGEEEDAKETGEEEEEVIAVACWAVFKVDPWSEEAKGKPEGAVVGKKLEATWLAGREEWRENKEFSEMLLNDLVPVSESIPGIRGRGHLHLYLLFTSPHHHRTGAGSALVIWGTAIADSLSLPCVVFASEFANEKRFYHKHGFLDVASVVWNSERKKWAKFGEARSTVLFRPVRGEEAAWEEVRRKDWERRKGKGEVEGEKWVMRRC